MSTTDRIYLDNAATTFPKPNSVYDTVDQYQREHGMAVGRGATRRGAELQRIVDRCRSRVARLLGAKPGEVNFTFSGTDGLNTALHGLLSPEDHVVTTCWEHNSVLRPLDEMKRRSGVRTTTLNRNSQGTFDLEHLKQSLEPQTRLVVLTHASNVTGVVQPVAEAIEIAHEHGALFLLDAAQTAGHFPFSLSELGVDIMACSGHKGLLGPLGTGVLIVRDHVCDQLRSFRQGGTGTTSESIEQPLTMPEKYESGNHNAPGIVGLEAGVAWLEEQGLDVIAKHEQDLTRMLIVGLSSLPNLNVIHSEVPDGSYSRVGVVSVTFDRTTPQVVSSLLDEHFQIETRAGLHCSPLAHQQLGTDQNGGTVRFSIGPFTSESDIEKTVESVGQIAVAM